MEQVVRWRTLSILALLILLLPTAAGQSYTRAEVIQHDQKRGNEDCWVIVEDKVFNLTGFIDRHPGGKAVIKCGADNTARYHAVHGNSITRELMGDISLSDFKIGELKTRGGKDAGMERTSKNTSQEENSASQTPLGLLIEIIVGLIP
ncbi:MAG: cytochrome b5 domain-containing protein [Candidatus Nanohaloarchaea archaeon]